MRWHHPVQAVAQVLRVADDAASQPPVYLIGSVRLPAAKRPVDPQQHDPKPTSPGSHACGGGRENRLADFDAGVCGVHWLVVRLASATSERRAQELVAVSFFLLGPYIAVEAIRALAAGDRAEISIVGLVLTAGTAIFRSRPRGG
jgi:hypothetical protein